jgi:hypothetical protein
MSILLQKSRVTDAGLLDPCKLRRYFAVKYQKSVTLLLSVKMLKTKILDHSAVEVSDQIYLAFKLKTKLTCRVAWRPSNRPYWPLQHLIRYCCEVRPKSRDAAMGSWSSLLAVSIEAAAICSLSLAFLSIYCTFIVFLYLCVRACVCVCVHSFFPPFSFQYIPPSYHLTSFLLHHSLTHPPNLTDLSYVLLFLFSDTLTILFSMRKEFVNIYLPVCVFSLSKP